MAGYVIHLAVGEEYIRKHPNEINNYEEFIEGVIYPDSVTDKSLTHYGPTSSQVNLKRFFEDKDINTDFNKGYCIHLITDYLFYNKFLTIFSSNYIFSENGNIVIVFDKYEVGPGSSGAPEFEIDKSIYERYLKK